MLTPHPHLQCRGLKLGSAIPLPALRVSVAYTGGELIYSSTRPCRDQHFVQQPIPNDPFRRMQYSPNLYILVCQDCIYLKWAICIDHLERLYFITLTPRNITMLHVHSSALLFSPFTCETTHNSQVQILSLALLWNTLLFIYVCSQ